MIHADYRDGKLCVICDKENPYYARVFLVLRSLLSVRSMGTYSGWWSISYDDFMTLRLKLDSLGLVDSRTMTQSARDYLAQVATYDQQNQDIKKGLYNRFIRPVLKDKLKTEPYEDQITGITYLMSNWRAGLFDSMGIGKTLQSLGAVVGSGIKIQKTLVICPKSVILGFTREIHKHTHLSCLAIPAGRVKSLDFLKRNKEGNWDILLVHPENLIQVTSKSARKKGKVTRSRNTDPSSDLTKILKTMKWDMIIVDEWHQYKNVEAKRTQCVLSILNESKNGVGLPSRCILMTGTPISESPVNAYVTLKVLGQDFMPHVTRFENYHVIKKTLETEEKGSFKKIVGYKNLAELKRKIERVSIRRTKDDLGGFPDKITMIRDVELSGRQRDLYRTVCGEVVASLPPSSRINLAQFFSGNAKAIRLRQLMNHPLFLEENCASAKYDEVDLILDELFADPEQKVILWTEYRKAVELIYDRWNERYGVVKIYGGVEVDDSLANAFEYGARPRIAACIPAKAGTGVDFLARARTSIYVDRPWSLNLFQQSLDRIHRRVKTTGTLNMLERIRSQPATLIFLDICGSIDELIRERLMVKQDVSDAIMMSDSKLIDMGKADLLKYLR